MQAQYNGWIVALSYLVAVIASHLALALTTRISAARGKRGERYVLALAATAMGGGIWAMHFVGMMAFSLPIPVPYSVPITFLSLVMAIGTSWFALYSISGESLSRSKLAASGLVMGGGVALMHYTGMAALEIMPRQTYDPKLLALSIVVAIAASTAALWLCFHLKSVTGRGSAWMRSGSALVMGLAIWGMHFTGMAAANFAPGSYCRGNAAVINNNWLAAAVALCAVLTLLASPLATTLSVRPAQRDDLSIRRWSIYSYLANGFLLAALAVLTVLLFLRVDHPNEAAQLRHDSFLLSDELMEDSDDLTRAADAYVIGGDAKFEGMYRHILAVYSGASAWPSDVDPNFWLRAAANHDAEPEPGSHGVSLANRMHQLRLAPQELSLLDASNRALQREIEIERAALNAMQGRFRDAAGEYTVLGTPDPALARRLMFDHDYVESKAAVMQRVTEFQRLMSERTERTVKDTTRDFDYYLSGIVLALLALCVSMGATYLVTRRKVASLLQLERLTRLLGSPDFAFDEAASGRDEIGGLARTFARMHRQVMERTTALEHEIAERKRAEGESRRFFDQSLNLLCVSGFDGFFKEINPAWETTLGVSREAMLAKPFLDIVHPDDHAMVNQAVQQLAQGMTVVSVECRCRCADGSYKPFEWGATPQTGGKGFYATGIDIGERKRAERELRASQSHLHMIVDNLTEAVLVFDAGGTMLTYNKAALEMHGYDSAPANLRCLQDMTGDIEVSGLDGAVWPLQQWPISRLLRNEPVRAIEVRMRRLDKPGWQRILVCSGTRIPDASGQAMLAVMTISDVTERRRAEQELHQAQKLESVGRLAAGIAHEINTPIQFVNDSCHFVRDGLKDLQGLIGEYRKTLEAVADGSLAPVTAQQQVQKAEEAADIGYLLENMPGAVERSLEGLQRVTTIVRSMKEFAHPDQAEKTAADLNQAILSTLTVARNEYKYVADLKTELGELPLVPCFIGDLNQAVLNIVVNAAHAVEDALKDSGGRGLICVRTRLEGNDAVIEIQDSGCGIPVHIRDKIFDPFFTTKGVGKGTGQGLAIARSVVVDKHHGSLGADSVPGNGTTFTIRIPAFDTARSMAEAA